MNALQIVPVGPKRERQKQYLAWVWNVIVSPRLEDRSEMAASMIEMMEQHLTGTDDPLGESGEQDLWHRLTGTFLDGLPEPLRERVLSRDAIKSAFNLEGHGTITIGSIGAEESEFWKAIAALAPGRPVSLDVTKEDKKTKLSVTLSLEDAGGADHHIQVNLGAGGYRIDDWGWRVGQDDPALRRAALQERADLFDRSMAGLDALNLELGQIPDRAQRIRTAELAAAEPMAAWYSRLATAVGARHGFALYELMPERAAPVLSWLRFASGATVSTAARTLAGDRGLLAMIDRFGGLPIEPDEHMIKLFANAPQAEREEALNGLADLPPWHALFVLKLLQASGRVERPLLTKARARAIAVAAATDPARGKEWQLFASLSRYVASKAPELEDWSSLEAEQQLAFVWAHASKIAILLIIAQVDPASVADYLDKATTFSPRELVERRAKYVPDAANPLAGSADRLRARAALPVLLLLNGKQTSGRVHAVLRTLLVSNDGKRGNEALLPAALAPSLFANSFFCIDFGSAVAELFPIAQFSFGAAMLAMVGQIMGEPATDQAFRRVWTFVRQASGDAPLQPDLASLARAHLADLVLTDSPDGLEIALHTIIAVAALAAINDWPELKERIDQAVATLWPAAADIEDRTQIFFEIAHWRARLESSSYERGRIVVDALRRFAADDSWKSWSVSVAQRFAKALAGQDAEPFIDFVAEMRS